MAKIRLLFSQKSVIVDVGLGFKYTSEYLLYI